MVFYLSFMVLIAPLLVRQIYANDLWKSLYTARHMVNFLEFPQHHVFAYSPVVQSFEIHSYTWLGDLVLFGIHQWTGPVGLQVFRFFILFIAVGMVHAQIGFRKQPWILAILVLFSYGLSQKLLLRNAIFAVPMVTLFIWLILRWHESNNKYLLFGIPPVLILWSNLHGSYLAGIVLLACFTMGYLLDEYLLNRRLPEQFGELIFVFLLSFIGVMFVKPVPDYSIWNGIVQLPGLIDSNDFNISNWLRGTTGHGTFTSLVEPGGLQSPLFYPQAIFVWTSILLILAGVGGFLRNSHLRLRWFLWVPVVSIVLLGTTALRFVGFVPLVIVPFLFYAVKSGKGAVFPGKRYGSALLIGLFFGLSLYGIFSGNLTRVTQIKNHQIGAGFIPRYRSEIPVDTLKMFPGERCYNHYDLGGYLIWSWNYKKKVLIDSRSWAYETAFLKNYYYGSLESLIAKYQIECAVMPVGDDLNENFFNASPEWYTVTSHNDIILFGRKIPKKR